MAKILDTIPAFEKFARKAGLEGPLVREELWKDMYQADHKDVFDAFFASQGGREGMHALARELSRVRMKVNEALPEMSGLIEEIEPKVRKLLGVAADPAPLHVLMVGTFSTNAFVARLGDEVALFHCLEWFAGAGPTSVLIAHEDAHAWHQIALGESAPEDLAYTAFYEGLAIQASKAAVPERPADDYFWYGVAGFEDWLAECEKDEATLLKDFRKSLKRDDATEMFFGNGFIEEKWRTGYYIADLLMRRIDRPLDELAKLTIDEGRQAIKDSL